jgi:exopolysaccharide production protein ExoZ
MTTPSITRVVADSLRIFGDTGVDLFFVLSGYLIYGSLIGRPQPFARFMARRIQRIYPAFLVVFVIYLVLSYAIPSESRIPSEPFRATTYIIENVLLLPGLFPIEPMITVAWSLSYEIFFYLAIPLAVAGFNLRAWSVAPRVAFFLAIGLAICLVGAVYGEHVRLIMFLSGMVLSEVISHGGVFPASSSLSSTALLVAFLASLRPNASARDLVLKLVVLAVAFFLVCWTSFTDPSGWLSRAFSWTPLRWLGNMSYSYYLLHGLVLKAIFVVALPLAVPPEQYGSWVFWCLLPVMFSLSLIPPAALFVLVERPFSLAPERMIRPAA